MCKCLGKTTLAGKMKQKCEPIPRVTVNVTGGVLLLSCSQYHEQNCYQLFDFLKWLNKS